MAEKAAGKISESRRVSPTWRLRSRSYSHDSEERIKIEAVMTSLEESFEFRHVVKEEVEDVPGIGVSELGDGDERASRGSLTSIAGEEIEGIDRTSEPPAPAKKNKAQQDSRMSPPKRMTDWKDTELIQVGAWLEAGFTYDEIVQLFQLKFSHSEVFTAKEVGYLCSRLVRSKPLLLRSRKLREDLRLQSGHWDKMTGVLNRKSKSGHSPDPHIDPNGAQPHEKKAQLSSYDETNEVQLRGAYPR